MLAHHLLPASSMQWAALPLGARLQVAASAFLGGSYGEAEAPYTVPGYPKLRQGRSSVCTTFCALVVGAAYPDARWTTEDWRDFMVAGDQRDSPLHPLMRHGVGDRVPGFQPGRWHLCQGWRWATVKGGGRELRGHSWLALCVEPGLLYVLQSSPGHGARAGHYGTDARVASYNESLHIAVLEETP